MTKLTFNVSEFAPNLWHVECPLVPAKPTSNSARKLVNTAMQAWYNLRGPDSLSEPYRNGLIQYPTIPLVYVNDLTFTPSYAQANSFTASEWTPAEDARSFYCLHGLKWMDASCGTLHFRVEFDYRSFEGHLWHFLVGDTPLPYTLRQWVGDDFPAQGSLGGLRERLMKEFITKLEADLNHAVNTALNAT